MDTWLQRLAAGKVEPSLKLDVLEASAAFPALAERLTTLPAKPHHRPAR